MDDKPQRCTNEQRQRTLEQLSNAFSQGQLNTEEFEERSTACWEAVYVKDLEALVEDIATPGQGLAITGGLGGAMQSASQNPAVPAVVGRALQQVTGEEGTHSMSISLFGGTERSRWVVPAQHTAVATFGGTSVDLTTARFNSPQTRISAHAFFGGTEIRVPEGIRVRVDGAGIMGGYDLTVEKGAIHPEDLPPDAPELLVTGLAFCGGVQVTVVRSEDAPPV